MDETGGRPGDADITLHLAADFQEHHQSKAAHDGPVVRTRAEQNMTARIASNGMILLVRYRRVRNWCTGECMGIADFGFWILRCLRCRE